MTTPDGLGAAESAAIELRGVVKDYASGLQGLKVRAVDGVTLRIARGQVYGLLGANGSGKSTLLKIILGLVQPTAGSCAVLGTPAADPDARRKIGYVPDAPQFYPFLTGRELVRFHARLAGTRATEVDHRVGAALNTVDLDSAADRRMATYSKGMLQRAALAQALVHEPELLILDEPTTGLDPRATRTMLDLIRRFKAAGNTVVLTSHLAGEVEDVCDRIAIFDRGRVVVEGEVAGIVKGPAGVWTVNGLAAEHVAPLRDWLAKCGATLAPQTTHRPRLQEILLTHLDGAEPR